MKKNMKKAADGIRMKPSSAFTPSKISKEANFKKSDPIDFSYTPKARTYSDSEKKMMSVLEKGKKADGTMKEGAQRKIASIRAKERLASQKVETKPVKVKKTRTEKVEDRAENKIKRIQNRTENKLQRIENRAENKAGRVVKRAAVGVAKDNVKAVRKSFKK
jgi:hypothetical protein